jgi:hypothetical protein
MDGIFSRRSEIKQCERHFEEYFNEDLESSERGRESQSFAWAALNIKDPTRFLPHSRESSKSENFQLFHRCEQFNFTFTLPATAATAATIINGNKCQRQHAKKLWKSGASRWRFFSSLEQAKFIFL